MTVYGTLAYNVKVSIADGTTNTVNRLDSQEKKHDATRFGQKTGKKRGRGFALDDRISKSNLAINCPSFRGFGRAIDTNTKVKLGVIVGKNDLPAFIF